MRVTRFSSLFALAALAMASAVAPNASAAIIFDDFNLNEGHFALAPDFSGSKLNLAASSTADQITTDFKEGAGSQKLVFDATTAASSTRVRFLSGGGTPANNTLFTTSAGTDGFIGFYLKTLDTGWTAQIALDGPLPDLQGGVPKAIIADGAWHLYAWDLDLAADWGAVASIGGNAVFEQGNQTIDSIMFRNTAAPAKSTIYLDFVAKTDSGTVANLLVPEPATLALAGMGLIGLCSVARRKNS